MNRGLARSRPSTSGFLFRWRGSVYRRSFISQIRTYCSSASELFQNDRSIAGHRGRIISGSRKPVGVASFQFRLLLDIPRMVDILRHCLDSEMNHIDAIFAEQPDGRNQPLCGLYRRDPCLPKVETMLSDGEWRIQRLRERLQVRVIGFSEIKDIQGSEFLFLNLNTPEEYRAAVEIEKMRLRPIF